MEIDPKLVREYYNRKDIQNELLKISKNREVQIWINQIRGKRPEVINYTGDINSLVRDGMTSLHVSVERWKDPLQLKSGMTKKELDELRLGFDLLLDIDSKCLDYSKLTADLLVEALKFHEVKDISIKYSGNAGFHIAVPFEAFPETIRGDNVRLLFPDLVRVIASYLKEMIKPFLTEKLLKFSLEELANNVHKTQNELLTDGKFDPFNVVDIDTILISSRHMFRSVYSLNEKRGLVSIPIKDIKSFKIEDAEIKNVKTDIKFLDYENVTPESAKNLLLQAYDWNMKKEVVKPEYKTISTFPEKEITEEYFPPCITSLMAGLKQDGRKRSIFILMNFLINMGWSIEKIEAFLNEWNKKNYEPLKEGYIKAQVLWYKRQNTKILPANCDNQSYYKSIGICNPDGLCGKIKNPVNYAVRKVNIKKFNSKK
ncbi:MAG: hypothetical protein PHF86_06050 [Candidatus Nanoarchaeia archaeon]|nr:hypothetical protein [Candidatus Nanoarchaeia archaeon]